jgi:Fe2+ transport system protein B
MSSYERMYCLQSLKYLLFAPIWKRFANSILGVEGRNIKHSAFESWVKWYVKRVQSHCLSQWTTFLEILACCIAQEGLTESFGCIYSTVEPVLFFKGIINKPIFISIHQRIERKFACSRAYFCLLVKSRLEMLHRWTFLRNRKDSFVSIVIFYFSCVSRFQNQQWGFGKVVGRLNIL